MVPTEASAMKLMEIAEQSVQSLQRDIKIKTGSKSKLETSKSKLEKETC